MMYPLLACSIIVLTVVIERAIFWLKADRGSDPVLVDSVLELARTGDWEAVREKTRDTGDYVVRILIAGILHRDFSMAKAMESAAADVIRTMNRFMPVMDTMITVAPLLGIFGTVIGIIASFDMLGSSGIEHPEAVTAGIAQALLTTATGLGIAILTVFPYNYFNTRIETAIMNIEKHTTSLEIVYEKLDKQMAADGKELP